MLQQAGALSTSLPMNVEAEDAAARHTIPVLDRTMEVLGQIEQSDAAHARIMRRFFGVNWENPLLYHLVLNTGSVPVETCVRIVRLLADDPTFQETGVSQAVLADKLIEARIRAILDNALPDKSVSRNVEIAVAGGKVTLSGALMQSADLNAAVENIRLIEGVTGVDNNIHRVVNYGV